MNQYSLTIYLLSLWLCLATACSHKMEEVADGTSAPTNQVSEATPSDAKEVPLLTNAGNAAEEAAAKSPRKLMRRIAHFSAPSVRTRNGKLLNRYYFIRSHDTRESVAQKIFGDAKRQDELFVLDSAAWEAGHVILYPSAQQPADQIMRSYFEDFGIKASKYSVKTGDTVSSIAEDNYDDPMSWKEIALLNNMKNANRIEKGDTLYVYPENFGPMVAVNSPPNALSVQVTAPLPPPVAPEVMGAPRVAPKVEEASVGIGGVLKEHWLISVTAVGLCVVLFLFFRRRDEEWDYRLK